MDLELAGCQAQVPALVRLITVQPTPGNPRAAGIEPALPVAVDSGVRRARSASRLESDDHSLPRHQVVFRSGLDDQAAVTGEVLLGLRRLRVDERHCETVLAEGLADWLVEHRTVLEHSRPEAGHPSQPLRRQNGRAQLPQQLIDRGKRVRLPLIDGLDRERRESERLELAERVAGVGRYPRLVRVVGFRDEQRIVRPVVACGEVAEIRKVDIGSEQVERGRAGLPDLEQVW